MNNKIIKVLRTGKPFISSKRMLIKQRVLRPFWKLYYMFKESE